MLMPVGRGRGSPACWWAAPNCSGPVPEELDQEPHAVARSAGRQVLAVLARLDHGHAGHVDVRPGVVGERLQEDRGGSYPALCSAGVLEVGHFGLDAFAVLVEQGHVPHGLVRGFGGGLETGAQRSVVGEERGCYSGAYGDYARTREGGDVDDRL